MKHSIIIRTAALLAVGGLILSAGTAEARNIQRSGTYQTGAGRTGTYNYSATGNANSLNRQTTVTTQNGTTVNRNATIVNNGNGTFTKNVTHNNGTTTTINATPQGSGVTTGTYNTSTGQSGSFTRTVRTGDGSVSAQTTRTDQNGNVLTRTSSATRDANGVVHYTTVGPYGHEHDVNFTPNN